jgi:broad specificity phosphatase PhoE
LGGGPCYLPIEPIGAVDGCPETLVPGRYGGPMSPAARLLLVRHGQSTWNAAGRWQGQADPPLSDLGRLQAKLAAAAVPSVVGDVTAVWSSDLQRAAETARIIAAELDVALTIDEGLRERDAGEWSGLTRDQIEERFPGYLDAPGPRSSFAPDGARRRPPGWESDDVLLARAVAAFERIAATAPGAEVLVVTHGGLIYTVEHEFGAPHARLANAEGRWVIADDGDLRLGDRVLLLDDDDPRLTVPDQL